MGPEKAGSGWTVNMSAGHGGGIAVTPAIRSSRPA